MDNRRYFLYLVLPASVFLLIFLVLPMVSILVFSFLKTERYQILWDWNIDNYLIVFTTKTYVTFIIRSFFISTVVTLISLVYAYPVAYGVAKYGGRYKIILVLLTASPFLTGEIIRVTAMQQILGPIGIINMLLSNLGMEPVESLMYSNLSTIIGLIYLWLPFMVLAIYLSLLNFNFELEEVARINGANGFKVFKEVVFPLNKVGLGIGVSLVFIPSLASSVTSEFLGGPDGTLYGNILSRQFGSTGTWAFGSALGVILFLLSLMVLVAIYGLIGNLKRSGMQLSQ